MYRNSVFGMPPRSGPRESFDSRNVYVTRLYHPEVGSQCYGHSSSRRFIVSSVLRAPGHFSTQQLGVSYELSRSGKLATRPRIRDRNPAALIACPSCT